MLTIDTPTRAPLSVLPVIGLTHLIFPVLIEGDVDGDSDDADLDNEDEDDLDDEGDEDGGDEFEDEDDLDDE